MSWYDDRPWMERYDENTRSVGEIPAGQRSTCSRPRSNPPGRACDPYLGGTLDYREVDELSDGVAAYLTENGFGKGDRLAIYLQNVPQFVLALLGTWKAGGVVVPLNPMYRDELSHILTDAGGHRS